VLVIYVPSRNEIDLTEETEQEYFFRFAQNADIGREQDTLSVRKNVVH